MARRPVKGFAPLRVDGGGLARFLEHHYGSMRQKYDYLTRMTEVLDFMVHRSWHPQVEASRIRPRHPVPGHEWPWRIRATTQANRGAASHPTVRPGEPYDPPPRFIAVSALELASGLGEASERTIGPASWLDRELVLPVTFGIIARPRDHSQDWKEDPRPGPERRLWRKGPRVPRALRSGYVVIDAEHVELLAAVIHLAVEP